MEYIYASLLLHSAKKEISEDNLKKVLSAAGLEADDVRVKMVVAALKEVNIDEVLKTAAVTPMAVGPATAPAAQPQPTVESKPAEEKKEEEKKEVSEEELAEGLSSLFG
ncbi:MAG: 50S ribosomal protein P1 [Sulfolobales archaeon]